MHIINNPRHTTDSVNHRTLALALKDTIIGPPGQIPLKVPNVEFNFDVSVDRVQWQTVTLKSNLTLSTHLHAIIRTHNFLFQH